MKIVGVIVALVAASYLLALFAPYAPPVIVEDTTASMSLGALIFALPIIGLCLALRSFGRWHRGFHGRIREKGLW